MSASDEITKNPAGAVREPGPRLTGMELFGADESARVMEAWNRTDAEYPARSIHRLFEEQAAATPDAVAAVFAGDSLTYRGLDERADRIARRLAALGVGLETRVAVCLERSLEMVAAILAVLKAGGAYVPLDPGYPAERVAFILADSGAAVLLTQASLRAAVPERAGVAVVSLDGDGDGTERDGVAGAGSAAGPGTLAYVMYTSGSTGTPKGVGVEQRGVVRLVKGANYARFGPDEVILQAAPISFDASTLELWGALLNGGRLVLAAGGTPSLEALGRTIREHGVTTLWLTAGLFQVMARERLDDFAGVRQLLAGGDVLPAREVARVLERFPDCRVINGYGPTENTTFTCCCTVPAGWSGMSVPIGAPISNTRAYVLDEALRPAAVGEPGELYAGGAGVARGYLGRPALTAERFVPDPFSGTPGARMYRTGDRVRWTADGKLEFLGRLDGQVKIRGFRIEIGEVEAALRAHAGVADAAVAVRPDAAGEKRLVGYVVGHGGGRPGAAALRAELGRRLPAFMVPARFVAMDALPLDPNGKVDRRALPAPPERPEEMETPFVAPRTGVEAEVAAVWAEVLGVDGVGVEDDLFSLGAHSLAVTRAASRLRARFGVELPLREMFGAPTVAAQAQAVARRQVQGAAHARAEAAARTPAVERAPRGARIPLSTSQERVWFLVQLAPDNLSYNFQGVLVFRGALDVPALRGSLTEIVRRHEIFRTTFPSENGRPYQEVHAPFAVDLPLADLSGLPAELRAAEERRILRQAFAERYDLTRLPLIRWLLLRRAADEHVLVHLEHHIVHDGWSFNVFLRELLALYGAFAAGRPSPLPEPALQFGDYAAWQRRWMEGAEAKAQLAFWRERLAGSTPVLELPFDRPRPAEQRFRGAAPRFELSPALYERLRAASHAAGVTLFATMLAAYHLLLSRWSGQTDLNVGTGIANRRLEEVQGLIGMFVNSVVVRATLDDDPSFAAFARRVHAESLAAADHQEIPFESLVDALRPDRSLSHNPLYQAMFSFHDSPIPGLKLPGLAVEVEAGLSNGSAKFDLNVIAIPRAEQRIGQRGRAGEADGITLVWEYSSDLFDAATIDQMFAQYRALLEAAAGAPETPVSRLPLVRPQAREALLAAGRATRAVPVSERVHERFERRAAGRPDAPALTCEGATLSYGELNARANRLARRLRAMGVGPETRVGIALERSAELVVAILGVLKAGGAYVPLDPAYPADRIAFVLEDAGAAVLVTTDALRGRLPASGAAALCIDADAEAIAAGSAENAGADGGPESLAYVIYTSGSTGRPKGVQVTHANVVRLFDATDPWFGFGADDVWTLFHSCAFDFSVWEIWGALLYGGRLVVVPFLTTRSPEDFHRLLVDEGVTSLSQTPSAFAQLVRADAASGAAPSALRLRHVVFGGEALDPHALGPWIDRHGDQAPRLVNMYGITETTVHVTFRRVTRADAGRGGSPIGAPIPDLALHLLDRHLDPVPPCVPGELFVGGAGVARGYLGRPELTAERFVRDPFSADPQARLYRSGDLARRRADGELEYLGRADQQVKVRGFRIETGEIEAALASHPSVAAAAVVARGDAGSEKRLVAYVVAPAGTPAPSPAALRAHVAESLPDYMVPAAFVALDALPLTENGKLDRRALPAPGEPEAALAAEAYAAPRTPVEAALAEAWAEVLGLERVGIDDNYFAVGGDSIRSVGMVAAARRRGITVTIPQLFRQQTIRELAEVAGVSPGPAAAAAPAEDAAPFARLDPAARRGLPDDVEDAYPASQVQLAMLYHTERDPGSHVYINLNGYRVHTRWDEAAMREALRRVAARHPLLRTSFDLAAAPEPIQRVHRRAELPLEVTDIRQLDAAAQDAWFDREKGRGFDWTRAPLLRFHVHLLSDGAFRIILAEHHALFDGWSVASLMTELLRVFVAVRDGLPDPTGAPPAARYRDFVALEREAVASPDARAFWRGVVAEAPLAALPPREGDDTPRADDAPYLWIDVPAETAAGVRRLAAHAGVPIKTVLLAAHLRVLSMLGGVDDVVTGYVTNGRPEADDGERVLGVFLNTVPLRVDVAGATWTELVRRAWEAEQAVIPHRRFPLAEIVREAGGRTLFEAFFNYNHFHVYDALAASGVRLEGDRFFQKTEVPLLANASVNPATGVLRLRLEYDAARLGEAQVRAIGAWYARALDAAAAEPDAPARRLPLATAEERARVVEAWNRTDRAFPRQACLHELFDAQAARTPDAPALEGDGERLTYRELGARANRLAHLLVSLGAGPDVRVGVLLERGLEMVVALLAVMKAGGCCVPLDTTYPPERMALMLADSGARVLLTRTGVCAALGGLDAHVVRLDEAAEALAAMPPASPRSGAWAENLAYVFYTSGSTGRPKGVAMGHREVVQLAACLTDRIPVEPGDRVAQASNASFDAAVFEMWGAWLHGAALVGIDRDVLLSATALKRALRERGITHLYQTAALFSQHVREEVDVYATLRVLVFGAEAVGTESVRRMLRHGRPGRVLHEYGPTEATVWCTLEELDQVADDAATIPIGVPIPNARAYVLDAALEPLPPGVPGVLYVGGAGVVRGYLGRPALTAERFVPDPFAAAPGARMYCTGDRVRWRADGKLEFMGRVDDQVKVRGFRIEPAEVERALAAFPGVRQARMMVREDVPGDKRIVAYLVGEVDAGALRAHLRQRLPEYMVPQAFVAMERLPLTPNGKLDRAALPAPEAPAEDARYVAPRTPVEEVLAEVWAEVLGRARVGIRESFFELGGHSLLATRAVSRIRKVLGIELPLRALFEAPAIADLAGRVDALRRAGAPALPPVVPVARGDAAPLSFAQERLWFLDRLAPGSAFYNVPAAVRMRGPLDGAALERALGEIVRRHASLRTTIRELGSAPAQVVAPFAGFALPVEDLSGVAEDAREEGVRRRAAEEAARPFDLARGPLFRATLLRVSDGDHALLVSLHHVVSDGWSLGVLFRELSALYAAFAAGRESPLAEPAVQYADFAAWQREQLSGDALDRQLAWWTARLAGAPPLLEIPADRPRPAVQTYCGAREWIELPAPLLGRLRALGRSEGATLFMVLLGAFQVLLSKYAASEDLVVGTPIAGRTRREVEEVVGFFVNTLALRTDLSGDPSFRELLRRVREATLGAFEHQDVPFEKLVAELHPERSLGHSPVVQVTFALQDADGGELDLPGLRVEAMEPEIEIAKFDLSLSLAAGERGLRGAVRYATDLFDRATIARMIAHFAQVLDEVAEDADRPLSALATAPAPARRQGPTPCAPRAEEEGAAACLRCGRCTGRGTSVARLFEARVARDPGAPAMVGDGWTVSYRELNARANRVAHHLRRLGVGAESRVGVALERGPELAAAVLGILKAGGAYVPLDAAYPAERISHLLRDSAVAVVLTDAAIGETLPPTGARVVRVDADAEAIGREAADDPAEVAHPESAAYVFYTSGSTGGPKGVVVSHAAAAAHLAAAARAYGLGAGDRVLVFSAVSFDPSLEQLLAPLAAGAAVAFRGAAVWSPAELADAAERLKLTVVNPPTAYWHTLAADAASLARVRGQVRLALVGGEALRTESVAAWHRAPGTAELANGYGPTEGVVTATVHRTAAADAAAARVPIGTELGGRTARVLDGRMRPVPDGIPGELYLGGAALARGYQGRAALTAGRFVPDPYGEAPGARLYRTGDRVRRLPGGGLDFLGRVDEQVKVRGFRIEPGEIESALRREHGVCDCAVVAREDGGDRRLVAYVAGPAEHDALRAALARSLPAYMVPAAFVTLDAIPLTPGGKVDRRALPAPERAADGERYLAPRTPAEAVLAAVWAEVLGRERIGVREGFFELGGHSLLATRVVSRIREVFGVELPLRAVFEAPTVADLTGRVEALRRAGAPVLPPIVPVDRGGAVPLSFAQERLWFLDRLQPGSAFYNVPVALRLGGTLDAAALERALAGVVRRHEALRTTFREVDGRPAQVIAPFAGFALPIEELAHLPEPAREAEARRRATDEAARPFDLAAGPLFRAALLRLGAEDHVLLLSMHHAVSDGWSLGVLFAELGALYAAHRDGREPALADLPVAYADYAVWQREQLRGEALDRQLAYWKGRLHDAPALLELPADRPRPAVQGFRGARAWTELPAALAGTIEALARSEGATPFMVTLAAFQVLLSKYAGTDDLVVGTPIAGRGRREVEALVGFFSNTLALRADLSGDPTFRVLVGRVREATLGAFEHQDLPFEKLVAELQPERSLGHSPLFQVTFALEDGEAFAGVLPGVRSERLDADVQAARFDLSLALAPHAGGITGVLLYSADLFDAATARRMLDHLGRVLEQVTADADVRLSRVALAGADERRLLVDAWNRTARPYPRGVCVHALFDAQARERPDAQALAWGGESVSYAELGARANRLAHHLASLGVGPEARVGVLLERGVELVVSLLAVLKAGGCYVPLDPGYPAERLRLMLADAGARVLVGRGGSAAALASDALRIVSLDDDAEAIAARPSDAPRAGATPDNLAYIVYTSGSTGRPKGVMVGHREVVQLVCETDFVRLAPGDRVAQASNASFDALTFEAWGAFLNGATLVGVPRDVLLSTPAFAGFLRAERITTLYQTTALLNQHTRERGDVFSTLREVLHGGQAVDADRIRGLLRSGKPERLLHVYGPTETTAWCSYAQVEQVDEDAATVSVGRPIGNARIYVLDAALEPTPLGVPGEAYVGGDGVVRGYLDRPALTAARFVPDPFAARPGARMYRTGDRLRWKADGTLEFLGRLDEQVKIRGFRIEPGEVESAIAAHPGVREVRVVARRDEPGETRLVAYVVGEAEMDGLRAALRGSLPDYMLPAAFVALDRIPLTAVGKLDRKALPAPEFAAGDRYVAPRTPAEEMLAGVWAEVLGVGRVGVRERFFDLGGHSLLAMRVVSRIRELFAVELPLRALFESPTVAELAGRVEALRGEAPALPPVVPVDRGGALPLSFAQERLWFLDRMRPGSSSYNSSSALRLTGALDEAALARALGEIVRRHETLRTTFAERDGRPVQVIAPFHGFAVPVADLSALEPAEREREVARRAADEAAAPFDLAAGPLFRAALLRLAADAHVLVLGMHHVVVDGWSMGVLFRELSALYAAFVEGRASPLAEPAVQYVDFATWQRTRLGGDALDRQVGWWKARLSGAPALLELPTDHPRPPVQTDRGGHARIEVPAERMERLRALARREGATLYMVLLAAFQALLAKYAGSDDVVVGSPIAGRTRRELEALIGFFVNTLVLRTDLSGDPPFRELLRRVREVTLGAYEHQEVPFEKLVEALQPERSLSHAPLFQVMFALAGEGARDLLPGIAVEPVEAESAATKFDLNLVFAEGAEGAHALLQYNADLFEPETAWRMLRHLSRLLEQVAGDAELRLSRLELLDDAERGRVLSAWNDTERPYAIGPVHLRFAEQARRTPDAAALLHGAEATTYAALDRRAEAVARRLRALGVGPEVPVGLCAERTPELLAGVLGIWKAGGAYVPLDPGYPAERLGWIVADAALRVIVAAGGADRALPDSRAEVVRVESLPDDASSAAVEARVSADNLAYVIYTSGSTGRPKGVLVQHGSLANLLAATREAFGVREGDVVPALASYAFDIWLFETLLPLTSGAAVRLVDRARVLDVPALLEEAADATLLHAVPALMRQVARVERDAPRLGRLRRAFVGGDRVAAELLAELRAALPWAETHVLYGPTEGTILASCHPVPADGIVEGHPIGTPFGNVRLYVCDPQGSPQPVGVPGELLIGGAGVARGYLGLRGMTAERFVPDPFGAPGARLYRTGDRARWRADGTLEYLGRLDRQVKIRGFRIEPGELEAVLRRHAGVADCIVALREDAGETRLVAYVVGTADAETLKAHLRRSLPEHMLPGAIVPLDRLPLTPNGKVDAKALPAPERAAGPAVLPRNALEERVAEVWRELLGAEGVGVHDNFFDLGGSSLLLYRVYSRLKALRADLTVVDLFRYPSVEALAGHLGANAPADAGHLDESRSRAAERRAARHRARR
jgi:amino acid adenylation domain-containing protein